MAVKRLLALLLVWMPLGAVVTARSRMDAISAGRVRAGTVETFRVPELEEVGRLELSKSMPGVVSELHLTVSEGWAEGVGNVDFLRLQSALSGEEAGFLWKRILNGKRPVTVRVRVSSGGGKAKVDVERVSVSGISLEGAGLEFVLRAYVRAVFPDAVPGEWFPLDSHVESVSLHPARVAVVVK